ncbi:MAG: SDR family oxidoreductase [Dehalococcoidia bacterium]|nr:SDR family oxidoreductase [Dehalococcoidia bacterium]
MDRKVGVVTGAGGDIGIAVCQELARRGVGVMCVDRTEDYAERAANAIRALGGIAETAIADVSIEGDVAGYASRCRDIWGEANFFLNLAGIEGAQAPLMSYPTDMWDRVMNVNLRSMFLGLKAMFPLLHHADTPRIVNMASTGGLTATPMLAAYGASKHAVIGLTKTAAIEFARYGIAVNALCPGPVEGTMMGRIQQGEGGQAYQRYETTTPQWRYGKPLEVAQLAAFLLLDCPMYMTGQAIGLDGGLTAA